MRNVPCWRRPPDAECVHWIGAGTKDTGISLTRLTFQITHATDSDTNVERDYIIDELRKSGVIGEVNSYKAGQRLASKHVNHYVTDDEVTAASPMGNRFWHLAHIAKRSTNVRFRGSSGHQSRTGRSIEFTRVLSSKPEQDRGNVWGRV